MNEQYVCGTHSRNKPRQELPKRSRKEQDKVKEEKYENDLIVIEKYKNENLSQNTRGDVILTKMYMMKEPQHVEGYYKIFPNFKHQNRKDGYGCMKLSPMSLGPVEHGQPGLPDALNIENFHQSGKCFQEEIGEDGYPSDLFYENQIKFYLDPVPHRHKYKGKEKNVNIPIYSVWRDKDGLEHYLSYIESRQFYCTFYERLASQEPDFEYLRDLMNNGYNLQICGYDAYPIEGTIEEAYLDPRHPFGHERVLMSMLVLEPNEYPWRKHKTFDF